MMKTITHKASEPIDKFANRLDQASLYQLLKARLQRLSKNDKRLIISKGAIIFFHYGDELLNYIKNRYAISKLEERLLERYLSEDVLILVEVVKLLGDVAPSKDVAPSYNLLHHNKA